MAAGGAGQLDVTFQQVTHGVDVAALASRSRNTPYAGMTLTGRVRHTLLGGEAVVVDAEAQR